MNKTILTSQRNRTVIVLTLCLISILPMTAQNASWAKKAAQSVFTLKTFRADGSLLASSNGFFIDTDGLAVSSYSPFKGAHRAVIIDALGKELPVESLIGANDMYDVAKFRVESKKVSPLSIATTASMTGDDAWLLPYAVKKEPRCPRGTVSHVELFQDKYTYYTIDMQASEQHIGSPVMNAQGQVIGILQPAADSKQNKSYAVSAQFATDLRLSGLSVNDPALRLTSVPLAIPDELSDATLSLYVASSSMKGERYADYIERFIRKYPKASDGYVYRARLHAVQDDYAAADQDMQQAIAVAEKKDDAHYQYAQLISQKVIYKATPPYEPWTLSRAMEESQEAYRISPQPIYRQLQAQLLFAQNDYEAAYQVYMELTATNLRGPELFYAAAQCKLHAGQRDVQIALLDSAVNTFSQPYVKTAAPYLLARAQALNEAGKYRPAVSDYNAYEKLMGSQLNSNFYFLREQAEFAGHLYQQAIDDIKRAIELEPQEPVYHAEKANIELRVGMADEALASARECIRLSPDHSDGYLFLGLALCVKGQKQEGLENLRKAKELGDPQAQTFIDRYSK